MELTITVQGKVVPKQSARFVNMGGYIKAYQKKSVKDYAELIKQTFIKKYPKHDIECFREKMIKITISEYRAIPKSKPKTFKMKALDGTLRPITRPDTDNIAKNVKDALNGVCYPDDSQIVQEVINKFYSSDERLEIKVEELIINDTTKNNECGNN